MAFWQNNPWVGYADRDYLVMKSQIITAMQDPNTGIPEITDHTESNPFIKRLSIWCGINEQLGYYIDNKGRETFVMTARIYASMINLAREFDYRVRGAIPATAEVTFSLDVPIGTNYTIPQGTVLSTQDGFQFITVSSATITAGQTSTTVNVRQWVQVAMASVGTSNGQQNQTFALSQNTADGSISVLVGGVDNYTATESWITCDSTTKAFQARMNFAGVVEVAFGDGINGVIPTSGADISIGYFTTSGSAGNVGANTITQFVTVLTPPVGATLSATNVSGAVNGTDAESVSSLRKMIPLSLRTLYRAVSRQDYIDVAELAPGVARAGVIFNCGKYVELYIAPNGGGIASPQLITDTDLFMDDRKMITTFVRANAAGLVVVKLQITVTALPNYYNTAVEASVVQSLTEFFDIQEQDVQGSVFIGDLYQKIENTVGVRHSVIVEMVAIPYPRPLDPSFPDLSWSVTQLPTANSYTYILQFITTTTFNVIRNSTFLGQGTVGTQFVTPDVDFTIQPVTGGYSAGNQYSFNTYVQGNSIVLTEPSLLGFDVSQLTISVTGGLI